MAGIVKDYTKDLNYYVVHLKDGTIRNKVPPECVRIPIHD